MQLSFLYTCQSLTSILYHPPPRFPPLLLIPLSQTLRILSSPFLYTQILVIFLLLPGRILTLVQHPSLLEQSFPSPHLFGKAQATDLVSLDLSSSHVSQYVDNLLLGSPPPPLAVTATYCSASQLQEPKATESLLPKLSVSQVSTQDFCYALTVMNSLSITDST